MTKEQIANLHVCDEIWLAKFKLGYNEITNKITALLNYSPKKFIIRHYLCDNDFNVVGFDAKESGGNFVFRLNVDNLVDDAISENLKYATSEKEITEWYENHKREQKEVYMKQLESAVRSVEVSRW